MEEKGNRHTAGAAGEAAAGQKTPWTGFSRIFLLLLLVASLVLFLFVIRIFLVLLVVAAVFVTLFYPWYEGFVRALGGRKGFAALMCCILLFTGFLAPVYFIGEIIVRQAVEMYQDVAPRVQSSLQKDGQGVTGWISRSKAAQWLRAQGINWQAALQEGLRHLGRTFGMALNVTSQWTAEAIVNFFVLFYMMFYFFRDGDRITGSFKRLIPMEDRYKDEIIRRFGSISRSTVKVTLVIGLIQGSLGALTLLVFGIPAWLLWGVVMVFLAIIPVLGSWIVLVPAGIIEIASGRIWQGISIIALSTGVISVIDNILRPRLVGRDAGMHDLLIFVSTLGGMSLFGVMGFIVGPMAAALFLTVTEIYSAEFRKQISASHARPPAGAAPGATKSSE